MKSNSYRRESGGYLAEDGRRSRSGRQTRYVEARAVGGFRGENRSRSQTKAIASTTCTLCHETLRTNRDLQAHLASPVHLDMVVRYPTMSLQDILISEEDNTSFGLEQSRDGRDVVSELGVNMSQALGHMLMVRNIKVNVI